MHSERMFGLTASVESGCLFFREQALYNEFENFVLLEDKIMSEEVTLSFWQHAFCGPYLFIFETSCLCGKGCKMKCFCCQNLLQYKFSLFKI